MSSSDRSALLALSRATHGVTSAEACFEGIEQKDDPVLDMKSWDTDGPLSSWKGVEVDRDGRVVDLILTTLDGKERGPRDRSTGELLMMPVMQKRLRELAPLLGGSFESSKGELPDALPKGHEEDLSDREVDLMGSPLPKSSGFGCLQMFRRDANRLSGSISPDLGKLNMLIVLDLSGNALSGSIPPELGKLFRLVRLDLSENALSGPIPPTLGYLDQLESLYLNDNQLSGPIPPTLGNLEMLGVLSLGWNKLSGPIPPTLADLIYLQVLDLRNNKLSGPIPPELGYLDIERLCLGFNELSGSIPSTFCDLECATELDLYGNKLSAVWDHTEDIGDDKGGGSGSEGSVPLKLRRLLELVGQLHVDGEIEPSLENNPWIEPPESIVEDGEEAITGYFEDLYAGRSQVRRNNLKIVVVGRTSAGKTSLCRSIKANKANPTSEGGVESTVFADMEPMEIDGASVRVYDCAGQVAYTGLLQMFLTPRSVCVLVCDAEAFGPPSTSEDQVDEDCRKLEELGICDWLRSMSWRVPDNDVILVATKCDLAGENCGEIGRRMEAACRTWLASWVGSNMPSIRVEDGVSLTSCGASGVHEPGEGGTGESAPGSAWECDWRDDTGEDPSPSLLHRLVNKHDGSGFRGAQMLLPQSWDIALNTLEALERGIDPVDIVVQRLSSAAGEAIEMADTKAIAYQGITEEDLCSIWAKTVRELESRGVEVINAKNALEGALTIREFDGSIIRYDGFVVLDVVWLTRILKPLFSHKESKKFDGSLAIGDSSATRITLHDGSVIRSWAKLKSEGILEPRLAHAFWPDGLSEHVLPALAFLGLTFPRENDPAGGLVVLLRLAQDRPASVGKEIDTFCAEHTLTFSARWVFFLGVPPGTIEEVLTRCCSIGDVQTFWRAGVLVRGGVGKRDRSGAFSVVIEYASRDRELTARVYGDISSSTSWSALSYVISAVRSMLRKSPGLRSEGFLKCPEHGDHEMLLSNKATRGGERLLDRSGCGRCSSQTRELGAAAVQLLRMVDIKRDRDEIFADVRATFVDLDRLYPLTRPTTTPKAEDEIIQKLDDMALTVKEGSDETKAGIDQMLGGIQKMDGEMKEGFDATQGKLDEVKGAVEKTAASAQDILSRLKTLQASDYPYPHLVVVREVDSSISSSRPKGAMSEKIKRLGARARGKVFKDMTLRFLCSADLSEVPCGFGGEGFRFSGTRDWAKKLSPVLQVAVVTAKVVLKVTTGLDVGVTDFLNDVKDGLFEEVLDSAFDEEALGRVLAGQEEASAEMEMDTKASYEALKTFIDKEEAKRRNSDGYVDFRDKMKQVGDGKGGFVWVRHENVQAWEASHRNVNPSV